MARNAVPAGEERLRTRCGNVIRRDICLTSGTSLGMTIEFLVTHSGGFHADELLSSVILTRLFPTARIIRSRAAEWLTPGADRIIYDVGGASYPQARIFDRSSDRRVGNEGVSTGR